MMTRAMTLRPLRFQQPMQNWQKLSIVLALALVGACAQPTASEAPTAAASDADAAKAAFGDAAKGLDTGTDAAKPDAGPGDATAEAGAADVDAAPPDASAAEVPDSGPSAELPSEENEVIGADTKTCKGDAECEDSNACTTDTCTAQGCLNVVKSCDDGLACTADACDKNTGNCKHKALAETCAIEGGCYAAGEALATNTCKLCDPSQSATAWSEAAGGTCDDGNPCTGKDQCVGGSCVGVAKPGCCKADSDCSVTDACTAASCDVGSGACQFSPKPQCCSDGACCDVVANTIKGAGQPCGGGVVATQWQCSGQDVQVRTAVAGCTGGDASACSEAAADLMWSFWVTQVSCAANAKCVANGIASAACEVTAPTGCQGMADCEDKNLCTDDSCSAGECVHLQKKCTATTSCQQPACTPATGACTDTVQTGACEIDGVCMLSGVKKAGDACLTCQPAVNPKAWSIAPACQCTGGACCLNGVVKAAGTACGTTAIATEYQCSADNKDVQSRVAFAGCSGAGGTCSTTTTYAAWQPWADETVCGADQSCEVKDKTQPGTCKTIVDPVCSQVDPYEDGQAIASAHGVGTFTDASAKKTLSPSIVMGGPSDVDVLKWTINDAASTSSPVASVTWSSAQTVKVCLYAACTTGAGGNQCQPISCPAGTVSVTDMAISGTAKNGCCATGSKGNIVYAPKTNSGSNNSSVVYLTVANAAPVCTLVNADIAFGAPNAPACTAGSTCCELDGTFSPKNKACGVITMASEYKCESNLPGGKVLQRKAVPGCAGTAASCSAASADYSWSDWTPLKTCLASEACSVTAPTSPGTCVPATACVPNSSCCTAEGKFAANTTLCGTAATTAYQCSGAMIQVRKQFSTCAGTSTGCYGTSAWSAWTTVLTCATSDTCTVGALTSTLPTCKPNPPNLCTVSDPFEGPEFTPDSKDLGTFGDASAALHVDPKVLLQSATDKDYFKFAITDDTNFYDPQVYIGWTAAKAVTVCAYYRCSLGAGGQDCAAVTCPFGSDPFTNGVVSAVKPNGCCKTAASGTLSWYPDATGLDETGTVFFNVKNADPACQAVALKFGFGGSTTTKCDPGNTCCSGKGTYAASTVTCGWASKVQYKCSTINGISRLDKQTALGQCSGTSTSCNTTTTTWGSWALDKPCVSPEVCTVGVPASGGTCMAPKLAGTCAGSCGAKSKDGCYCDNFCLTSGDCCKDFAATCSGTCDGACGGPGKVGVCWCDTLCSTKGDCCLDKGSKCP